MRRLASILVLSAAPLLAGQKALTVERICADPPLDGVLPAEVQWFPGGTRFSFIAKRGSAADAPASLWAEDAASGTRRELLDDVTLPSFGEGKDAVKPRLAGYRLAPGGEAVLLAGGGDLFLAALAGKQVRRLTATPGEEELAEYSPDGKWVSFVRDNDVFVIELATGAEARLTDTGSADRRNGKLDWVYEEELAGRKPIGYAWSPDSRWIAYLTLDDAKVPRYPIEDRTRVHPKTTWQHYPQPGDPNPVVGVSVVQVEGVRGARTRRDRVWSGGNAEYVPRFGWTPDSRAVWYELLDRPQRRLEMVREDVATGAAAMLFVERDAAWINLHDEQRFLSDGRLLWSTEAGGYRHLVMYAADGTPHPITSGPWELTSVDGVDEATGWIYFTATEAGPLDRQLYRVRPDGRGFARLSREAGTHSADVAPGGAFILDTFSTISRPPEMRMLAGDGRVLRTVQPVQAAQLADFAMGTTEFLTVQGGDGTTLHASLLEPAGFDATRKYPVVVYVYGGPHAQVVRDAWGKQTELFHQFLASRGFLVFSLDNRGSAARGREFERALLGRFGKVELEDQLAGVAFLKTLPYVDASRIGIWGWSYGGFMTCYALTNAPGVFTAGAAVAPVTDWRLYDSIYTERYLGLPAENEGGYAASSPVNQAGDLAGALLLVHGTGDDNVHWGNTLEFVDRLYKAGKPYDLQLYPNKTHSILGPEARTHLFRRIADHFERWLKP
jgi:dipeptidyl-peptidase-4